MRAAAALVGLSALVLLPALAHAQAPDPPGPYAIDARVVIGALPQGPGFFPPVPSSTAIPTFGLGLDAGAHIYLIRFGPARLGLGANLTRVGGRASPATPASSSTSPPPRQTLPDVESSMTTVAPQISLNFGSADGWSYISAGIGRAQIRTRTSAFATGTSTTAPLTPELTNESGSVRSLNVGGGARWFMNAHLAFSFDLRFHLIRAGASRPVPEPGATPGTTLIAASAGISLR